MNKKVMLAVVAVMLAVAAAIPVFAATVGGDNAPSGMGSMMLGNHQQMVQQALDKGVITREEADKLNQSMQEMAPIMQKIMQSGIMMNGMMGNKMNQGMMNAGGMNSNGMTGSGYCGPDRTAAGSDANKQ